jgi:glutamate-1-semialdehyde 2,1-aminomutase
MLQKGYLATNAFYSCYAHTDQIIDNYLQAVDSTFALISRAVENNEIEKLLKGPVAHSGFYRLA